MKAEILGVIDESESPEFSREEQPDAQVAQPGQTDETATPKEERPAEEAVATPEAQAESKSVFRFLNQDWESQAKAEEVLGSQEGRISKLNETLRDYEKRLNEYWEYINAVTKENEEYRAKVEAPKTEPEKKTDAGQEDGDWLKSLKLGMELARQRGLDPTEFAVHALKERLEEKFSTLLEEKLSKATEPLAQMEQSRAVSEAEQGLFRWAQETGRYPELSRGSVNVEFVTELYQVHKNLASQFGSQFAYSGPGFDYAYRLTRDFFNQQAGQPSPPAAGSNVGRDEKGRFTSMNGAARAASDINGTTPKLEEQKADPFQERLKELGRHQPITRGTTNLGFFE